VGTVHEMAKRPDRSRYVYVSYGRRDICGTAP
jgi:hypothetical protein